MLVGIIYGNGLHAVDGNDLTYHWLTWRSFHVQHDVVSFHMRINHFDYFGFIFIAIKIVLLLG